MATFVRGANYGESSKLTRYQFAPQLAIVRSPAENTCIANWDDDSSPTLES
jgi:hypothetical protein